MPERKSWTPPPEWCRRQSTGTPRAPAGSGESAIDGAKTGDVQQLDEEDAPGLHGDIVHTVGMGHSRRGAVIHAERPFNYLAVSKESHNQQGQTDKKRLPQKFLLKHAGMEKASPLLLLTPFGGFIIVPAIQMSTLNLTQNLFCLKKIALPPPSRLWYTIIPFRD